MSLNGYYLLPTGPEDPVLHGADSLLCQQELWTPKMVIIIEVVNREAAERGPKQPVPYYRNEQETPEVRLWAFGAS